MTKKQFEKLEVGDIIRHRHGSQGFQIINKSPLIAIRIVTPSNPDEWDLIVKCDMHHVHPERL